MRLNKEIMAELAEKVRPLITPMLDARGEVTNDELRHLLKEHFKINIQVEATLDRLQVELCEAGAF